MKVNHLSLVTQIEDPNKHRPLNQYYEDIIQDLDGRINQTMAVYLEPLKWLDQISEMYGYDSGHYCVIYFLSNSSSWRGATARRIKKELKALWNDSKYQEGSM